MKTRINLRFLSLLSLLFSATLSFGQFVVSTNADSGPGSLRQAIIDSDLLPGHNTITFNDDYTINLTSGKIVIHDDLTLTGTGIGNTIVDGSANGGLRPLGAIGFTNLEINGITFRNSISHTDAGALGISNVENARILNCEFVNNNTDGVRGAGALGVTVTNLTIDGCVFRNNSSVDPITSSAGAVGHDASGNLTIMNSIFENNSSRLGGGAIAANSSVEITIESSIFTGNTANGDVGNGGAIYLIGSANSTISTSVFTFNRATNQGGAIWNGTGNMTIIKSNIDTNKAHGNHTASGGGGIFNDGGTLNIGTVSVISNNLASGPFGSGGGVLSTSGDVSISNSVIMKNSANRAGGAIEVIDGTLLLSNADIINNNANGNVGMPNPGIGGGLHISGTSGNTTIENSLISGNQASIAGGGIYINSGNNTTINTSIIDNNKTHGASQNDGGAGIYNGGILEISSSTISNNIDLGTNASGGGIHNSLNSEINILVSTISGNSVNGSGGGIFNNGVLFDVNAATIAFNRALTSGGGIHSDSSLSLKNTIVANNNAESGFDVSGVLDSNDYNLIGTDDTNVFPEKVNDMEEADASLGPLQNNGSGMLIHELLIGSEALNAGDPNSMFSDQIGQAVFNTVRDVGAFEAQIATLLSVNDYNSNISEIAVYPNPSKGHTIIKIPMAFGSDIQISLIELGSGKTVEYITVTHGTSEFNLNRFPDGVYILKMVSETSSATQRLILLK